MDEVSSAVAKPGVIYTRPWVVRFMLDLAGYVPGADLAGSTIVEPGCGDGEFLVEIATRLLSSAKSSGIPTEELVDSIRAYDLDASAVASTRKRLSDLLNTKGVDPAQSAKLVVAWVQEADFLLKDLSGVKARWIVGNPPYIRVEDLDPDVYQSYRQRWSTMSGRADVYIGFFEAGLSLLEPDGVLCFICADRWMHNQYGAGLRKRIIERGAMDLLLELHKVDVFATKVAAYPAITLIRNGTHDRTALITAKPTFDEAASELLKKWFSTRSSSTALNEVKFSADWLKGAFDAENSWPSGPPERLAMIAELEGRLPSLAEIGIEIGVGMATGADKVYVSSQDLDVEPDRLMRAIGPADVIGGDIIWRGRNLVSPWKDGELVNLDEYPRLRSYFETQAEALKARYVAQKNPANWWRTIDRPREDQYLTPKLIVADINDRIEPVLDSDGYWPLHSAYFIKSDDWDIEALGGYLLSDVAAAFVEAYSVRMAGGHLRISSQYLRKIRAPKYGDVGEDARTALIGAFRARDRNVASSIVRKLVGV